MGSATAFALRDAGANVRVMTRDEKRARLRLGSSFELCVGDVLEQGSVSAAVEGCDGVVLSVSGKPDDPDFEPTAARNLSSACLQHGVQQIVSVSGASVDERNTWFPMVKAKFEAEEIVRESGVAYTILRPTWFMDMLPRFVRNGRAMLFGKNPNRWHWIASSDFAEMVVAALRNPEAKGKDLFAYGPEGRTFEEALDVLIDVAYPGVKVRTISFFMLRVMAFVFRKPEMKSVIPLMSYFIKTPEHGDPAEANRILGEPTTSIAEWATEQKAKGALS